MAMGGSIDSALHNLQTLELDSHTLSFLCDALAECVDLNNDERREFLEAYLEAEDLDQMLKLLPAVSCTAVEANIQRKCHDASGEVTMESVSHNAMEKNHEVQHMQDGGAQSSAEQASTTAQRVILPTLLQLKTGGTFDKEASPCGGIVFSGIDGQEECFQEAGSIKRGQYVMIKDQPCRVMQVDKTSKIWKGPHRGCFQSHIIARGIFTGKKEDMFFPVTQKMTMPSVRREECTVLDIGNRGELSLLTHECNTKDDVNLPTGSEADSELSKRIQTGFDAGQMVVVIVLSSCERGKVVECKIMDSPSQKGSRKR